MNEGEWNKEKERCLHYRKKDIKEGRNKETRGDFWMQEILEEKKE